MHTRAHSPIHIQLWVNQTNQAATAATAKNHNFHFLCVARLPQWRLHYNLKFDQIRISHSDLLHHKWKCWKLIVDRVAMQLAYQNENILLSSAAATSFFLFLVFHHNKSSCPREHIANLSLVFLSCRFEINLHLCELLRVLYAFLFRMRWHRLSLLNQHRLHDVCHQLIRPRFDISVQLNRSQNGFSCSNLVFRGEL